MSPRKEMGKHILYQMIQFLRQIVITAEQLHISPRGTLDGRNYSVHLGHSTEVIRGLKRDRSNQTSSIISWILCPRTKNPSDFGHCGQSRTSAHRYGDSIRRGTTKRPTNPVSLFFHFSQEETVFNTESMIAGDLGFWSSVPWLQQPHDQCLA
jgi:hypothetical protein